MDAKIIRKEPLTLPKVLKIVQDVGKKEERVDIQNKVIDFAKKSIKLKESEADKLLDELRALEVPGITDENWVQVVNVLPSDLAELKAVLSGSKATISPDNFKRIQDVVSKYKEAK